MRPKSRDGRSCRGNDAQSQKWVVSGTSQSEMPYMNLSVSHSGLSQSKAPHRKQS